nr:hypothetical protein [Tanacetum cinerariifolium]
MSVNNSIPDDELTSVTKRKPAKGYIYGSILAIHWSSANTNATTAVTALITENIQGEIQYLDWFVDYSFGLTGDYEFELHVHVRTLETNYWNSKRMLDLQNGAAIMSRSWRLLVTVLFLTTLYFPTQRTKALELPYHESLEALDRAHRIRQKKEVPSASLLH